MVAVWKLYCNIVHLSSWRLRRGASIERHWKWRSCYGNEKILYLNGKYFPYFFLAIFSHSLLWILHTSILLPLQFNNPSSACCFTELSVSLIWVSVAWNQHNLLPHHNPGPALPRPPPRFPPLPTIASAASSVLASATLAPHLGNPANIQVYPVCAVCGTQKSANARTAADWRWLANLLKRNRCSWLRLWYYGPQLCVWSRISEHYCCLRASDV